MIICYATKRPVLRQDVAGTMTARKCDSLELTLDKTTAATIKQPRTNVTNMSLVAANNQNLRSAPFNRILLLSRLVKNEHGPTPTQPNTQVCNLVKER